MKHATALFCLALVVGACDSDSGSVLRTPTAPPPPAAAPSPPAPPPPAIFTGSVIRVDVGQEVKATLQNHGSYHTFELTAPSTGTLVAKVTWSGGNLLELWAGDVPLAQSNQAPMLGRLAVTAGGTYRLTIADGAAWDYDAFALNYALTTSIEQ